MPFYSSNEKLKRKRIAKESNKQLNIGSGSGEETTQPTETFTYREPKLFFNLPFTARFLNNIQVSDYSRKFRSANVTLPLKLNSVSIIQNTFQVSLDEENSNFNIYPNKSFQQMVDDEDISIKWFMDSVKVVGETNASLALDENNGDQGKTVYAEVTNNVDASVVISNTITVEEITQWKPDQLTSLTLWLDASDESTIVKDVNNYVSQWNDKSSQSNNFTQANSIQQPLYDAVNKTLYFDGSNDSLLGSDLNLNNSSFSFFIVAEGAVVSSDLKYKALISIGDFGSGFALARYIKNIRQRISGWNNGNNITNNSYYTYDNSGEPLGIIAIEKELNVKTIYTQFTNTYVENITTGTNETASFDTGGTTIIGYMSNLSTRDYWKGDINEIIGVSSFLPTTDKNKVVGYLAHKWNLTDKLPTNHPYKTTAP